MSLKRPQKAAKKRDLEGQDLTVKMHFAAMCLPREISSIDMEHINWDLFATRYMRRQAHQLPEQRILGCSHPGPWTVKLGCLR